MSQGQIINIPRRFALEEWGGTETVILETSKQLQKRGYDPKIYTTLALSEEAFESISDIDIRRHSYSYTRLGLSNRNRRLLDKRGGNMYSISLFLSALLAKKPKVFHLHTLGRVGSLIRLAAKIRRVPYVVSIHGGLMDLPKQQLNDLVAPTKRSFNWGKIFDWVLPSNKLVEDADAVICVGEAERKKLSKRYPKGNIHFLPNGVDVDYFASGNRERFQFELRHRGYSLKSSDRYILSVGSFYPQKNQAVLIRAFSELPKEKRRNKLVLMGLVYDQQYFESLKALAEELEVTDDVLFLTDVSFDNPTLIDAYAAAELFVLPSLYETFGVVVLEAWAAGVPVICDAVGGLPSFVENRHNGLFCPMDQKDSLVTHMYHLLRNETTANELVKNARNDVRQYSWQHITEKLSNIYQSLKR
ncbi:glycosyl transferase family 1 [Oleiphilus sp. HI0071]|uniref:glycosyltransferase family 4 protein n=3 Tax=unclassified Oleiphilus TaxID=2631174 RepID=UPI0007C28FCC|nr:glycosyltransferase family 4 protein [Oleiphilus sp. HI0079]KZY73641.1 glycosyl transferase family 1 [Oleiphilus sp. HI0065]KZY80355.1 glycosyl transferase family 1 [Oleiphilus sp. HI0071]KZZ06104.1 glycosyl transferase family 1 [Oleiphilus sp. HI0073]KZZ40177.1 glycosyl transferase family 1 [Oleiphilus sp. HI0118]KZZ51917.1 glycosyl transferase family 1 [Oleiphilus sp. HI0122]KZZ76319.1 glycosyl transferase family 1 [Oleiphilus sp. HI0133]